ncbi:MAG: hypothetical protein L3J24_09045 [Xanthomonadales bacterium]|nr:hypothetical protein [Xanthomonadales bacterium]
MPSPNNSLRHLPLFVAIESQAASVNSGVFMFSRSMARQLLAHLSVDLAEILPDVQKTAMTTSAAIYDQSQLLRPDLPIFSTLSELLEASFAGQDFQPRLLAFGAHKGQLPAIGLMPESELLGGSFQLIPLQLSANAELIEPLAEQLEHLLLEKGQLSAHSAQWLQEELGQKIVHARFMTLNDLLAMLYMQLETAGLAPLWQWLEKMLHKPNFSADICLENGPKIEYRNGAVNIHFLSFDQWAAALSEPEENYLAWLNLYRQSALLLEAHGLAVNILVLSNKGEQQLDSLYCEPSTGNARSEGITHHFNPQLGLLATSANVGGKQFNYYPLKPAGIEELKVLLSARYPKTITVNQYTGLCIDQNQRKLSTNHE